MFSKSSTNFGSCSFLPVKISVLPHSSPVTSRPCRINPPIANQVNAVLDKLLAAGLIHHSTLPWASPVVVIPKKPGGIRITVNCKNSASLASSPFLESTKSSQTRHRSNILALRPQLLFLSDNSAQGHDTSPCFLHTHASLMPQRSSAAPGWFVKVINDVIKGLGRVVAYVDDVIVFDADSSLHVATMKEFSCACESTTSSFPF